MKTRSKRPVATAAISCEDDIPVKKRINLITSKRVKNRETAIAGTGKEKAGVGGSSTTAIEVLSSPENDNQSVEKVQLHDGHSVEGTLTTVGDDGIVVEHKEKRRIEGRKAKEWVTDRHELAWDSIATSGDSARAAMFRGVVGQKLWFIGQPHDRNFFEPLQIIEDPVEVTRVPLEEADGIVCAGPFDPQADPAEMRPQFLYAKQKGLKLLCANPDIVVDRGES